MSSSKSVVLLSGGLDSATCLAVAAGRGLECHCLSFDYGQRHRRELDAARDVAASMKAASHTFFKIDLRAFGGSALTSDGIDVPKDGVASGVPVTYVPARNLVFLSIASAFAETIGVFDIFIGVNAVDYSGYPDCRQEFIESFEFCVNLATKAGIDGNHLKIHAPLQKMSKADIIQFGVRLGVDYSLTHSCYDPDADGLACGACDSCRLRRKGFIEAGVADTTRYSHTVSF